MALKFLPSPPSGISSGPAGGLPFRRVGRGPQGLEALQLLHPRLKNDWREFPPAFHGHHLRRRTGLHLCPGSVWLVGRQA